MPAILLLLFLHHSATVAVKVSDATDLGIASPPSMPVFYQYMPVIFEIAGSNNGILNGRYVLHKAIPGADQGMSTFKKEQGSRETFSDWDTSSTELTYDPTAGTWKLMTDDEVWYTARATTQGSKMPPVDGWEPVRDSGAKGQLRFTVLYNLDTDPLVVVRGAIPSGRQEEWCLDWRFEAVNNKYKFSYVDESGKVVLEYEGGSSSMPQIGIIKIFREEGHHCNNKWAILVKRKKKERLMFCAEGPEGNTHWPPTTGWAPYPNNGECAIAGSMKLGYLGEDPIIIRARRLKREREEAAKQKTQTIIVSVAAVMGSIVLM